MRDTEDLMRITPLIWKELNVVGIPFIRCGIFIMNDVQKEVHVFLANPEGEALATLILPFGSAENIGDTPTFHFDEGDTHWQMKVLNLITNEFVHWECIEASHFASNLDKNAKEEWLGTRLEWKFRYKNGQTEISLLHEGLNPELKCFNICERGWDFFFVTKLKEYLSTNVTL